MLYIDKNGNKVDITGDSVVSTPKIASITGNSQIVQGNGNLTQQAMQGIGNGVQIAKGGVGEYKPPNMKQNNMYEANNIGIRNALNSLGFDNDKIGWQDGYVTYDGNRYFKPEVNDNGTTKTNTQALIGGVNAIYKAQGRNDSLADVTSYATSTGLSNLIEYGNDGNVSIGGVQIPNTVIIDGQAYASTSDIANAYNQFKAASGYKTPNERRTEYYDNYGNKISAAEAALRDYKYDPETDTVYQAYRDMYTRNGQRARDDSYGNMASRSGGYANSAAIASGESAYLDYMRGLDDVIPQLAERDYQRKVDELNRYGDARTRYNDDEQADYYNRSLIQAALNSNYNRNTDTRDFNYKVANDEYDKAWDESQRERSWRYEDEDRARQIANEERNYQLNEAYKNAQIAEINQRIAESRAEEAKKNAEAAIKENEAEQKKSSSGSKKSSTSSKKSSSSSKSSSKSSSSSSKSSGSSSLAAELGKAFLGQ